MTEATIFLSRERQYYTVEGHATGSPEVCAAVSAISYTLAGWLKNSAEHTREDPVIELSSGCAHISAGGDDKTYEVFRAAAIGLLQIAATHKNYLMVEIAEE